MKFKISGARILCIMAALALLVLVLDPAIARDMTSCSAAYASQAAKTQSKAKKFGRRCLKELGATSVVLTQAEIAAELRKILDESHELVSLDPEDVGTFCPAYGRLPKAERAVFWQTMLTRISMQESVGKAAEPFWEFDQGQYSIGLLQLSLSDERGYHCGLRTEADLTDPKSNLRCGARIMTTLVRRHGRIGGDQAHFNKGAAAYWSTLRSVRNPPSGAPPRNSRSIILKATNSLPSCAG